MDELAQNTTQKNQKIYKIVITGGPCAGKTTAMSWIQNTFSQKGYCVLFVPETATELISGGVAPWTCNTNKDYQECQMKLQSCKEAVFIQAAQHMPQEKILIVCDRGMLDNKAYMSNEEFHDILQQMGLNEVELRDDYDAIFHLVTAAKGAQEFYTLANNGARIETVEQASVLDDKLIAAWTGHPYLHIIDNSTNFEEKMRNLIQNISNFLGEAGPSDDKRSFLIEYPDIELLESLSNCEKVEIIQTYLFYPDKDGEKRVRQRGADGHYTYYMTTKRDVSKHQRLKLEQRLTEKQYLKLLMDADMNYRQIRKTRYCLTYANQYFEIDVFPFWKDKAIAQLEWNNEGDTPIHFPEFLHVICEVTDEEEYKNRSLAKIK